MLFGIRLQSRILLQFDLTKRSSYPMFPTVRLQTPFADDATLSVTHQELTFGHNLPCTAKRGRGTETSNA